MSLKNNNVSEALVKKGKKSDAIYPKSDAICPKSDAVCQFRCRPTDVGQPLPILADEVVVRDCVSS